MYIYFDWELNDKLEQPLHKWVYEDIRNFLRTRYSPLEKEIDRRKDGPLAAVIVCWHENGAIETEYLHIPPDLCDKLTSSISNEDMDYIMEMIGRKIDNKANEN